MTAKGNFHKQAKLEMANRILEICIKEAEQDKPASIADIVDSFIDACAVTLTMNDNHKLIEDDTCVLHAFMGGYTFVIAKGEHRTLEKINLSKLK